MVLFEGIVLYSYGPDRHNFLLFLGQPGSIFGRKMALWASCPKKYRLGPKKSSLESDEMGLTFFDLSIYTISISLNATLLSRLAACD